MKKQLLVYSIAFFLAAAFIPPAEALEVEQSIDVELRIAGFLDMQINFFFIEEPEVRDEVDVEAGEGLFFSEQQILEAMGDPALQDEEGEALVFAVEHEELVEVTTFGNMGHELLLSAGDYEAFSGPEDARIPVDRLEWRHHEDPPGGDWIALTTEDEQIMEQERPGRYTEELEFRLWLDIEDAIGTYEGDLIFTVAGL